MRIDLEPRLRFSSSITRRRERATIGEERLLRLTPSSSADDRRSFLTFPETVLNGKESFDEGINFQSLRSVSQVGNGTCVSIDLSGFWAMSNRPAAASAAAV